MIFCIIFYQYSRMDYRSNTNELGASGKRKRESEEEKGEYISDLFSKLAIDDQDPKEEKVEDDNQCEVKRILDHRNDGQWQFLVQFKGDSSKDAQWVYDTDCNCEDEIRKYFQSRKVIPKMIYGICRVSSKNQTGPRHFSLEAQEAKLTCTANDLFGKQDIRLKILRISASAYRGIPTKLQILDKTLRKGDMVMIYRVDRLSRNIIEFLAMLEDWNTRGVQIFTQDENIWYHEKKLEFIQYILDATKEAALISKRVKASIEYRKKRGDSSLGSVPYGYRLIREPKTGRLVRVKNDLEQQMIMRIRRLGSDVDFTDYARKLNEEGLRKRGHKWTSDMVRKLAGVREKRSEM